MVPPRLCLNMQARTCRGKASEGSQGFSILLLLSCIFLYAAILPYSFEASSLICALRPFATSLSYAIMLSVFLARSLMLATADSEGWVCFLLPCLKHYMFLDEHKCRHVLLLVIS